MMGYWICATILLGALAARADDIEPDTCSRADVQAAIDSASDGDRVLVPSGNCTWSSGVTIPNTKGIVLQGAGIDVTTIVTDVANESTLQVNVLPGNSLTRVTGFTWDGNLVTKTGSRSQVFVSGRGLNAFRVDHNKFIDFRSRALFVDVPTGLEISGLIDNNIFDDSGGNVQSYTVLGGPTLASGDAGDPGNVPFSRPLELGTSKNIFFEDNTFTYANQADATGTVSAGGRYVFRYNVITGTNIEHHGADSGGRRGVHSFEIYENEFDTSTGVWAAGHFRSGVGVMFNNTYTGTYNGDILLAIYRSCTTGAPIWDGGCDGTNAWDENTSSFEGWRCLDQSGALFGAAQGSTPSSKPFYAWSNTLDASPLDAAPTTDPSYRCGRFPSLHMVEDRDFYNEDASFNGTSGIGVGTLASRPSTCTPEVGYWATDENKFYRCLTTDTWTFYYEPYTYPHPLQGEVAAGDYNIVISGSVTLSGTVKVQ
jgi:hypothetical protein